MLTMMMMMMMRRVLDSFFWIWKFRYLKLRIQDCKAKLRQVSGLKVYMEVGCQKSKIKTTELQEIRSRDYAIEEPHCWGPWKCRKIIITMMFMTMMMMTTMTRLMMMMMIVSVEMTIMSELNPNKLEKGSETLVNNVKLLMSKIVLIAVLGTAITT